MSGEGPREVRFNNRGASPAYVSVEPKPDCYEIEPGQTLSLHVAPAADGLGFQIDIVGARGLVVQPDDMWDVPAFIDGQPANDRSWRFKHWTPPGGPPSKGAQPPAAPPTRPRSLAGSLARWGAMVAAGAVGVAAIAVIAWEDGVSSGGPDRVQWRKTVWTQLLDAKVTVGERRQDVEAWLRAVAAPGIGGADFYDPESRTLSTTVEEIATPHDIACTGWTIIAVVQLDGGGRVVSTRLKTEGMCL